LIAADSLAEAAEAGSGPRDLFSSSAARSVDLRLRVTGYRTGQLLIGRLLAITGCGLVLAAAYGTLIAVDQDVSRLWAVELLLVTTVAVAAPLGAVLAFFVPGELEGALAPVDRAVHSDAGRPGRCDRQGAALLVDPRDRHLRHRQHRIRLPGPGPDPLPGHLVTWSPGHLVTWALLTLAAIAVSAVRLHLVRLPQPGVPSNG
jgi:hypothetical protein